MKIWNYNHPSLAMEHGDCSGDCSKTGGCGSGAFCCKNEKCCDCLSILGWCVHTQCSGNSSNNTCSSSGGCDPRN